jgi:hypothetical protein
VKRIDGGHYLYEMPENGNPTDEQIDAIARFLLRRAMARREAKDAGTNNRQTDGG